MLHKTYWRGLLQRNVKQKLWALCTALDRAALAVLGKDHASVDAHQHGVTDCKRNLANVASDDCYWRSMRT